MKTFFFFFFWRTPSFGLEKTVQISGKTFFFFFFLENTLIWAEKTASILTEKRNASSHFSGKSLLPPQIILSSYGHALKNQNSNSNSLILQKSNSNSNSSITCEPIQIQNSNSIQPPLFTPKIQRGFCNLHLASRSLAVADVH